MPHPWLSDDFEDFSVASVCYLFSFEVAPRGNYAQHCTHNLLFLVGVPSGFPSQFDMLCKVSKLCSFR